MLTVDLSNKVALITGGSKGIGRGICEVFLQAGATVIICARNTPETLPAVGDNTAVFSMLDVREPDAVTELVDDIQAKYGQLNYLINNAGGSPYANAATASPRFSRGIVELNLLAPLFMAQAANRVMQTQDEGGLIINITSVSGQRASPGTAIYGAAKAGLINLTRSLAIEWSPRVRVNALAVGPVETEQSHLHYGDAAGIEAVAKTIPLQRMALPADVGGMCVMLTSTQCNYLSGSCITLDGGGELPAFLAASNAGN